MNLGWRADDGTENRKSFAFKIILSPEFAAFCKKHAVPIISMGFLRWERPKKAVHNVGIKPRKFHKKGNKYTDDSTYHISSSLIPLKENRMQDNSVQIACSQQQHTNNIFFELGVSRAWSQQ